MRSRLAEMFGNRSCVCLKDDCVENARNRIWVPCIVGLCFHAFDLPFVSFTDAQKTVSFACCIRSKHDILTVAISMAIFAAPLHTRLPTMQEIPRYPEKRESYRST